LALIWCTGAVRCGARGRFPGFTMPADPADPADPSFGGVNYSPREQ
jgi:hypothetical protein